MDSISANNNKLNKLKLIIVFLENACIFSVMGDFNARVGRTSMFVEWISVGTEEELTFSWGYLIA